MTHHKSNKCPQCNCKGQRVNNATVKSLISVSLHRVADVVHRFCANRNCNIVYFTEDGSETFVVEDIRERVYQKEPDSKDVLVCYCFFHTLGDIQVNTATNSISGIVDDINWGIKQGHCACDWRNPQGNCCLGNVLKIVKEQNS